MRPRVCLERVNADTSPVAYAEHTENAGSQMSLEFEWDQEKAASNQQKHRISFEEAATVFADPLAAIFHDEVHSEQEQREIIVGHSAKNRLLLVCFTERVGAIRIIGARQATKKERRDYEENPHR